MSSRTAIFKFTTFLLHPYRPQLPQTISNPSSFLQSSRHFRSLKTVHFASYHPPCSYQDPANHISLLRSTKEPRTRSWNLAMKEQIDLGSFHLALLVFVEMRRLGVEVDNFTLPLVNRAISMLRTDLICVEMMHCAGIQLGFGSDVYFCNTLIESYVKSGSVETACKVFDEMPHRDLISWTSMVSGYANEEGGSLKAFVRFNQMRLEVSPNSITMITILQACSSCVSMVQGKQIHGYLIKSGFLDDGSVRNSLLKAYSYWTSSEEDVETLFREYCQTDAVSWNILISFYVLKGNQIAVKQKFNEMLQDVAPNVETLTIVATALSKARNSGHGEQLHCLAVKSGLLSDQILLTCFLNLYTKCGDQDSSAELFKEFQDRNGGLLQSKPEIVGTLLEGYANLGALHKGKEIHAYFLRNHSINSLETDSISETAILNMYAKCGSISSARNCFRSMVTRDVVSWTSMIEALGTYGLGLEALELFSQMLGEGLNPNSITFLSLLSACSHSGLAIQGCKLFNAMKWQFHIEPELHHYTCMVDLLGRMGKIREALCMILKMQCWEDSRIWGALLAASRTYMDRKIGGYAAKRLLELEPENVGYHVILGNMKASVEMWGEVEEVRRNVSEMDLKKAPGWSCVEIKGRIVGFVSWDESHYEFGEICDVLGCLRWQIQDLDLYCLEQMID